jgi:dihydrolipoamide dehydrogenase
MKNENYDLVIIGSGPGGYVAAIRAAQLGLRVAVVEKMETLGGTCLNIGCIPSKALLESSELFRHARMGLDDHGVHVDDVRLDLKKMMERKSRVVKQLTDGVSLLLKHNRVQTYHGKGKVPSAGTVEVSLNNGGTEIIRTKNILLATGSVSFQLEPLPYDFRDIVSSTEALSFQKVPESLIVIGAGAIGLELGSVWSRLGSRVVVLEIMKQVLPGWDAQVSRYFQQVLRKQGLEFALETGARGFNRKGKKIQVHAEDAQGKSLDFLGDKVLVATGRIPFHEGLGLEEAGVRMDEKKRFVPVDERYQTSVGGIYAIGDLVPGPMLAHRAEEEGIACAELIAGKPGHVNYKTIPNVIYTSPEVASVGKTEEQLKEAGIQYTRGSFHFRANGRALAMGRPEGFVKILADKKTDDVLGVHIVGPYASDLIGEAVTVMEFGGSAEDIARTVHAHPTLSETVREAALGVDGRSIHSVSFSGA